MPVVDFHVHTALIEEGRPGYVAHVAANQGVDFDSFVARYGDAALAWLVEVLIRGRLRRQVIVGAGSIGLGAGDGHVLHDGKW